MMGFRGLTVLVLAGLAGIALAVLGWSQRYTGLVAHAVGGLGGASAPAAPTASPRSAATESPSSAATAPRAGPSAASSAPASPGPLLSSEPYAQYAYLEWPGTPSVAARQAASGLTISVIRQPGGITVRAGVAGQPTGPAHFYANGRGVYVIESSLGDDSANVDYNLGDDGLVVTDAHGRILQ
jgi:hypothetical protein